MESLLSQDPELVPGTQYPHLALFSYLVDGVVLPLDLAQYPYCSFHA